MLYGGKDLFEEPNFATFIDMEVLPNSIAFFGIFTENFRHVVNFVRDRNKSRFEIIGLRNLPNIAVFTREPSLETELVRFDKHIRLNGTSGTFSDYFTKVIDVKSTGKDIIIFLGFEPITASPSPPVDEKVFGHFLVKEDNEKIVVYAKEDEHSLPPADYFNVMIEYADEGIGCAQGFKVTDRNRISVIVLDVGSHSSQAKVYDEKGARRVPLLDSMMGICGVNVDPKELDQCDETDK